MLQTPGSRILAAVLMLLLVMLQYENWFGATGKLAISTFAEQVSEEQRKVDVAEYRNRLLTAEVWTLKHSLSAVEARARSDLGMVKPGETFYMVAVDE